MTDFNLSKQFNDYQINTNKKIEEQEKNQNKVVVQFSQFTFNIPFHLIFFKFCNPFTTIN